MLAELITMVALTTQPAAVVPPAQGERVGKIDIPAINLTMPVRQGVSHGVLGHGVGHYPYTYLPGMGGNIVMPAHDVTPVGGRPYGPFHDINRLRRGNRITLTVPYGTYRYRVVRKRIISSGNTGYLRPSLRGEKLVLAMCWPRHSRAQRYLVVARRVQ